MHDFLIGHAVFHWIATWANPACDVLFRVVTNLGSTSLYFVSLAPLFWVVDRRRAVVLFALLVLSSYLNTYAKLWFDMPRPDPALARVLAHEASNGFPSGHTQNALVFWGYLGWWSGRRWTRVGAAVMVALIAFSRLYVGVHFPLDLLGGLLFGSLVLALVPTLERWAEADFPLPTAAWGLITAGALGILVTTGDPSTASLSGCALGMSLAVWLLWPPDLRSAGVVGKVATVVAGLLVTGAAIAAVLAPLGSKSTVVVGSAMAVSWIVSIGLYPRAVLAVAPQGGRFGAGTDGRRDQPS